MPSEFGYADSESEAFHLPTIGFRQPWKAGRVTHNRLRYGLFIGPSLPPAVDNSVSGNNE